MRVVRECVSDEDECAADETVRVTQRLQKASRYSRREVVHSEAAILGIFEKCLDEGGQFSVVAIVAV